MELKGNKHQLTEAANNTHNNII